MNSAIDIDDIVLDDSALLADRLVRSLHRNNDGHLSNNQQTHKDAVEPSHNVAVIYIYTTHDDGFALHEYYLYSSRSLSYRSWRDLVFEEVDRLNSERKENFYGVYGWSTAAIKINPLRNGDLFVKVDRQGAKGVRLTFDSATDQRTAYER